jgi:pimeloyl-ACP methyl ester carboxylesterase
MTPEVHYAKCGDVQIAYTVFGEGEIDLVWVPGFISQVEHWWEEPSQARWYERLGSFARVVMFDKRGTGLSDRFTHPATLEERMEDVHAVIDAVEMTQPAVLGISEGGSIAALFAATYPDRCRSLVLYGAFAHFRSWFPTKEALDNFFDYVDNSWGSGESLPRFARSRENDPAYKKWWGKFERLGGSPSAVKAIMRLNEEIDISGILPSVHVPTLVIHRTGDPAINVEGGRELARLIPNARMLELPGVDHMPSLGDMEAIAGAIEEFLTGAKSGGFSDRTLATVVFTDIVDSTAKAEELGDQRWQDLLATHNTAVRNELQRFRGTEVKPLGDGFLATFDGPARAVQCSKAIVEAARSLGLEVRAGAHTGEVEIVDDDIHGIAVNIASRVVNLAGPNETLVTRTVKDLIAGSGIKLEDVGTFELKGLPEEWAIYRAIV